MRSSGLALTGATGIPMRPSLRQPMKIPSAPTGLQLLCKLHLLASATLQLACKLQAASTEPQQLRHTTSSISGKIWL